jgi:hypothetical protein
MTTTYCAGILCYSVKNGSVYFLLGRDYTNSWADLGGSQEPEDESIQYTACREFYEESIGSVMDISSMLDRIKNKHLKISDFTPSGLPYYMYVVKIPFFNYRDTFKSSYYLLKYMNNNGNPVHYKYTEKNDLQWLSLDDLESALKDSGNYNLRNAFKKTMNNSFKEIVDYCKNNNEFHSFVE